MEDVDSRCGVIGQPFAEPHTAAVDQYGDFGVIELQRLVDIAHSRLNGETIDG